MTCTPHKIIKEDEMGQSCDSMGRIEVHARLTRQHKVKRLLRGATRRWKDNIEINFK